MLRDLARIIRWLIGVIATIIAVLTVAVLAYGQVGKGWRFPWDPKTTAATSTTVPTAPGTTTTAAVAGLTVAPEDCGPGGYDRDAFGDFTDETYARVRASNVDGWTGAHLTKADRPQVDHIVPVHEAACSGLDPASYAAFYNDTSNLLLTAGSLNASKSDKEPGEWEPPTPEAGCRFAATWVAVKTRWHLTVDPAEAARLTDVIGACQ